jgi:putative effector of murein hydrolase LrgA (UPF0299 family)
VEKWIRLLAQIAVLSGIYRAGTWLARMTGLPVPGTFVTTN